MLRRVLLLLVACVACVTTPVGGRVYVDLVVSSIDWYASRAHVLCDGSRIGTITGLQMTETRVKRVFLRNCQSIQLHVVGISGGGDVSTSRVVDAGECVRARVGPRFQSTWEAGCLRNTDSVRR